jgi:hypothetical protein
MSAEDSTLETAYRTVAAWLHEPLGPIRQTIPKMPDLEQTTGLKLKTLVEEFDSEIELFKNVLDGKEKPRFTVVEPPSDSFTVQKAKRLEQERQADKENIEKGIAILEKRRNKLWRRLQILKLKQPIAHRKLAEANQIIERAQHLNAKIMEETDKLKTMLREMESLKAKYNNVFNEFQKTNLDEHKQFPPFNVEIPRTIKQTFS